ncbi:hypothetical protein HNY73_008372 [Argiope bruennichi]|uniref:C2H2-type domain-containing protein n=1 Tax=Argiope bruennichi TaxID=94029 RepID=A0A8T0F660_ARGBR|nr:hypothetical protein HNY73_008372 [Argiope bruennichi]
MFYDNPKSLLGIKSEENIENIEKEVNESDKEKTNRKKQKKKKSKETKNSRKVKDKWSDILQEEENASTGKKKRKCHKRKKSKRVKSTSDSDDERNVNNIGIEVISKSYLKEFETSAKHSNHIKSSKHSNFKYSRPCVVSDNDHSSYSDEPIRSDSFLRKSKESRSVYSDDEHSLSDRSETSHKKRYLRSPKIKVKQEVFSDDDNSSYFERLSRRRFRNSDDSNDSASYHSRSHRKRYSDDDEHDRISEYYSLKREVKQDTVLESEDCKDSEEFSGSYYCKICKLTLNSESTWQSHKLGKRHAKAERAQEVHKVVKSSLLPSTSTSFPEEGNRYDKPPPGMKRIELKDAVSSIERACDDLPNRQLIGLKHVWEIREKQKHFIIVIFVMPLVLQAQ